MNFSLRKQLLQLNANLLKMNSKASKFVPGHWMKLAQNGQYGCATHSKKMLPGNISNQQKYVEPPVPSYDEHFSFSQYSNILLENNGGKEQDSRPVWGPVSHYSKRKLANRSPPLKRGAVNKSNHPNYQNSLINDSSRSNYSRESAHFAERVQPHKLTKKDDGMSF